MEYRKESIQTIVSKISGFSNIIVYYGYLHGMIFSLFSNFETFQIIHIEGAELFTQLGKKSKKSWDENQSGLINIIMRNATCRYKITFGNTKFDSKICNWLLKSNHYLYYSLSITMKHRDNYKAGMKFLNNLTLFSNNLFDEVVLHIDKSNNKSANQFLELYKSMKFPLSSIVVEMNRFYQESLSEVSSILEYTDLLEYISDPSAIWRYAKKGEMLEVNGTYFQNKIEFGDLEFEKISITFDAISFMIESEILETDMYKSCESIMIIKNPGLDSNELLQKYALYVDTFLGMFPNVSTLSLSWMENGLISHLIDFFIITKGNRISAAEEEKVEYTHFKQIQTLKVMNSKYTDNDENELVIWKNNVKFTLVQKDKLKSYIVPFFKLNAKQGEYFQFNEFIAIRSDVTHYEFSLNNIQQYELSNSEKYEYQEKVINLLERYDKLEGNDTLMFISIDSMSLPEIPYKTIKNTFSDNRDSYYIKYTDSAGFNKKTPVFDGIKTNSIMRYQFKKSYNVNKHFTAGFMNTLGIKMALNLQPKFQILELRIFHIISKPLIIKELVKFGNLNNKLRDLELTFASNEPIEQIFKALENNYMIKTVRLYSEEIASENIINFANEFSSKRISVDIKLNTKNMKYKASNERISEFHYPDEFGFN